MKNNFSFNKKIIAFSFLAVLVLWSCTDDFTEINTNPESPPVNPEDIFFKVETNMFKSGTTWTDSYRYKMRWMQYTSGLYYFTIADQYIFGFGGGVYGEYNNVGQYVTAIDHLIETGDSPEKYILLKHAARILLISKGMHTTDAQGSLAYTTAWLTRKGVEGDAALNPAFQTQQELYTIWDRELKECLAGLKAVDANSQIFPVHIDVSYGGKKEGWIKAANALRLRIALRLWKREPATALQIATEVLAADNQAYIPAGNKDGFVQYYDKRFAIYNEGDWHSMSDMSRSSRPFMTYLKTYNDPRKRMFFHQNNLEPEYVAAYNALEANKAKQIPATISRWEGGKVNPATASTDTLNMTRNLALSGGQTVDLRIMNRSQARMWKGTIPDDRGLPNLSSANGDGGFWNPILTYADFCFMAAEFVLVNNIPSTKTAAEWYTEGIMASVRLWNEMGKYCDLPDYEAITETEIADFMETTDIKWNAAIGLEQIYAQAWVEHFKNTNESWAQWKRVEYPNLTSPVVRFEKIVYNDNSIPQIPRKVRFEKPAEGTNNYQNIMDRINKMEAFPEFLKLDNEFGRLWWEN